MKAGRNKGLPMSIMQHVLLMAALALSILNPAQSKQPSEKIDDSVESGLAIYRSAEKLGVLASKQRLGAAKGPTDAADEAYDSAYNAALRELLRIANPNSSIEQRSLMTEMILAGAGMANEAYAIVLADAITLGESSPESTEYWARHDGDEAFRFGYEQARRRIARRPKPAYSRGE